MVTPFPKKIESFCIMYGKDYPIDDSSYEADDYLEFKEFKKEDFLDVHFMHPVEIIAIPEDE